jgi:hypothetical protein
LASLEVKKFMNTIKKIILGAVIALSLVGSFANVVHAQTTNECASISTDQAYEDCCVGQTDEDSQTCQAYAIKEDGGNPQCANITSDAIEQECCGDGTADSAVCVAYNSSSAADANTPAGVINADGNGANQTFDGAGNSNPSTAQPLNIHLNNPLSVSTIGDAVNLILSVVIRIALPLIILFFIWSGLTFIFARGNPTEVARAKQMFLYTIIGTLLILGAWVITNAIIGTVNSII